MENLKVVVHIDDHIGRITPNLYGHFIEHLGRCIYDGIWVGEDSAIPNIDGIRKDVVEALRQLNPPVLRWPGGCFADDYHWRDGVGPRSERPTRVNIWWGRALENNQFGTHEFIHFCRLIGAEPYICGNLGSGTPQEMRDWVEYCNFAGESTLSLLRTQNHSPQPFRVRYWGVGNENWGCGGSFCPEDYASEYKRFATFLCDFSGNELFLIACGPSGDNTDWTFRFFDKLGGYRRIHGFSVHYYTRSNTTATEFNTSQWYELLHKAIQMEKLLKQHRAIMDGFDPEQKVALVIDEWGTWHQSQEGSLLFQQNTMRDALVAGLTLDIFNRHSDNVAMANIAQTVNVLHSLILTRDDRIITTPTYHIYDMYKSHQGGESLRVLCETDEVGTGEMRLPRLSGSASLKNSQLTLSLVNASADEPVEAEIELRPAEASESVVTFLVHEDIHAHNTFENPEEVRPLHSRKELEGRKWSWNFPPASVTVFRVRLR